MSTMPVIPARKSAPPSLPKGAPGSTLPSTTPYGYVKDPLDHNHWLVDEEAAQVVRRIFQLTVDGYGPYQISQILAKDKVEIPAVQMARHHAGLWQGRIDTIKDRMPGVLLLLLASFPSGNTWVKL